jgi:transposase-like protein
MRQKRKRHADEFKARVAMEAVKGIKSLGELSTAYSVHPTVIAHWKRQLIVGAPTVFSRAAGGDGRTEEQITAPLFEEIGRLKMEVDWLKKKL